MSAGAHDVTVAFVGNMAREGRRAPAAVHAQLRRQLRLGGASAHSDRRDHRPVWRNQHRRHAVAPRDLYLRTGGSASRGRRAQRKPRRQSSGPAESNARGRSCRGWHAAPIGARSPTPSCGRCWRSTRRAAPRAASIAASSADSNGFSPARSSSSASRQDPPSLAAGAAHRLTDVEIASRLSFFLWSSIPDETLLAAGRARQPAAAGGARRAGRADAGGPEVARAGLQLRRPVAAAAQRPRRPAEHEPVSGLRRQPAAVDAPRDRAAVREHRPRGPERPRSAARGLHLSGRAAGAPLRRAQHLRQSVPPRRRHRRPAPRAARPRVNPGRDVARRAHVARAARQVGAREPARADRAAAAGRRAAAGDAGRVRRRRRCARRWKRTARPRSAPAATS